MVRATPVGILAAAMLLAGSGNALADPDQPAPAPGPPPETIVTGVTPAAPLNPLAAFADLLGKSPANAVLGIAAPPGGPAPDPMGTVTQLLPQNYGMPTGDESSPYVLAEGGPAGPLARIDAFQGAHALLHAALGRMPGGELGQPLPGTAPPPGTALPPGLVQYLPDPVPSAGN